ncbi:MAG: hypothetical protein IPO21_19860 [Bacteroidales bacterium]|nr:hypothetical protein [Bacteroidales bacterium]
MASQTPKQSFDQPRFERSEKLQQTVLNLMIEMKEMFSSYQEYKTIIMNLTTVSKELNSIRIKEITGDMTNEFSSIDMEK